MGIIGGILSSLPVVDKLVGRFFGSKEQREKIEHRENKQILSQFASEFTAQRKNRTWWDSLWDGINRAPRPLFALGVIGLFVWAPLDPNGFAAAMNAYALVPQWLAALLAVIVGFYFGARHLEKRLQFRGPDPERVRAMIEAQREIRDIAREDEEKTAPPAPAQSPARQAQNEETRRIAAGEVSEISDTEYQRQMDDEDTPLSDDAIARWNAENNDGYDADSK